jgi:hypothetical protein
VVVDQTVNSDKDSIPAPGYSLCCKPIGYQENYFSGWNLSFFLFEQLPLSIRMIGCLAG